MHITATNTIKHILLQKIKDLEGCLLNSGSFKKFVSYVFSDACDDYSKSLKLLPRIYQAPVVILIYFIGLAVSFGIVTASITLAAVLSKSLLEMIISQKISVSKEVAKKYRFVRVYYLHNLLRHFKEVTYSSMADLFVKRIIENKMLEEKRSMLKSFLFHFSDLSS